jgi:hypothetical protein
MLRWICFAPLLRRNIVPRLELMTSNLKEIAVRLDDAARLARSVDQLLEPLTIDESYEVQALSLARRYERGERRVGVKMGFTSRAKMVQMGLDEMIWGSYAAVSYVAVYRGRGSAGASPYQTTFSRCAAGRASRSSEFLTPAFCPLSSVSRDFA